MERRRQLPVALLVLVPFLGAVQFGGAAQNQPSGQGQPGQQAQPASPGQTQDQRPPTLRRPGDEGEAVPSQPGAEPGPTRGPRASVTNDARRLLRVKNIFIEDMDNRLSESLATGMGHERFRVVTDRRQADALLHGSCLDSARKKMVDSQVYLTGADGKPIWSDAVRHPYKPPTLAQAVQESAAAIVEDLKSSLEEAQH